MNTKTAEFVSEKHPDKICDFIADSILDAYLAEDKESRVAVEVMGGHKLITINGEVTSNAKPDIEKLVQKIVGIDYKIISNIVAQSPEIGRGVDAGGAGDQGIMKGYATNETPEFLPLEYVLARDLCKKIYEVYPFDGKTQVTIESSCPAYFPAGNLSGTAVPANFSARPPAKGPGENMPGSNFIIKTVVVSFQNTKNDELLKLVKEIIKSEEYLINPAGEWTQGGFDADTGLSGRKLIIDNYGPEVPIGGGSFSGKDYTKVDRSGAYMARRIAVELLEKRKAKEVYTKLAYAIGKSEPVMAVAVIDGVEEKIVGYDLSPHGIRAYLKLDEVKFGETSNWGHFGRGFEWK
jgi:S-adenosylmethionine synthetase